MEMEMKRCLLMTTISFILFFIYYVSLQPDYVMDKDEVNIRLCTVYALMFSSAMGLLYLCIVMGAMNNELNSSNSSNSSNSLKVESPTFN